MKTSVSTISTVPLAPRIASGTLWRYHIDALPDEIVRRAFMCLNMRDRRYVAQVSARWRILASSLLSDGAKRRAVFRLPWNVLKRLFSLLDSLSLTNVARVCVRWETIALSFFSGRIGRRHVHDLPAEVIKQSFALLDFDNLRYAAQVCVRWRDLGIEHPGFWSNIEVTSATDGSLNLLAARLGQSTGRPCSLTVDIKGMHPLIEARLMGLIAAIMSSVKNLTIRLDSMYLVDLWAVLNYPAPQLADFHLRLYSPDRLMPRDPISTWIFEEIPGLLRRVYIEDVILPIVPRRLPAFAHLESLHVVHPSKSYWDFPGFLLEYCPSLSELVIYSGTITFNEKLSAAALRGLSQLDVLEVHLADVDCRTSFVQNLPMRDIPLVIVSPPPDFDAFYDFLEPVRSPFNLAIIRGQGGMFFVIVEDDRSTHKRVFGEQISHYHSSVESNDRANLLFENDLFPAQVKLLHVSTSIWKLLVPYLSLYTVVERLSLVLDERDAAGRWALPADVLQFPNLDTLVLTADDPYIYVPAGDIVQLVDNVLCARRCRRLELQGVLLTDERHPVLRRFESVVYFPQSRALHTIVMKPKN